MLELADRWGLPPPKGKGVWLRSRLAEAVHTGVLPVTSSLPGARELARALGISRGTVDTVYAQLTDEGFLRQQPRRRPTVVGGSAHAAPALAPPTESAPPSTPGVPDAALFPHRAWSAANRAALADLANHDLGYPDPAGHPRLRAVVAEWLSRTRGVLTSPDGVHITAGVSQALWLLSQALDASSWAVERLGSDGAQHLLRQVVTCRTAAVDGDGLVPNDVPADSGAVLATPSHQYPTGVMMPAARRRALVDACRTAGRWLVEDDYDSHLAKPGVVPAAVQALAPDTVVLVGSLSKLLAPGLRIGWIVAPDALADRLRALRQRTDLGGSVVIQLAVAELISSGALDRHLRLARAEYARRRTDLAAWLAPHWSLAGVPVGVHGFVPTDDADRLLSRLSRAGVPALPVEGAGDQSGVVMSVAAFR